MPTYELRDYVSQLRRYLKPETMLLLRLYVSEEPISFSRIAKETLVPRSAVVSHLQSLTQEGLISSQADASHHQRKLFSIEDAGISIIEQILDTDSVSQTYSTLLGIEFRKRRRPLAGKAPTPAETDPYLTTLNQLTDSILSPIRMFCQQTLSQTLSKLRESQGKFLTVEWNIPKPIRQYLDVESIIITVRDDPENGGRLKATILVRGFNYRLPTGSCKIDWIIHFKDAKQIDRIDSSMVKINRFYNYNARPEDPVHFEEEFAENIVQYWQGTSGKDEIMSENAKTRPEVKIPYQKNAPKLVTAFLNVGSMTFFIDAILPTRLSTSKSYEFLDPSITSWVRHADSLENAITNLVEEARDLKADFLRIMTGIHPSGPLIDVKSISRDDITRLARELVASERKDELREALAKIRFASEFIPTLIDKVIMPIEMKRVIEDHLLYLKDTEIKLQNRFGLSNEYMSNCKNEIAQLNFIDLVKLAYPEQYEELTSLVKELESRTEKMDLNPLFKFLQNASPVATNANVKTTRRVGD